MNLSRRGSDLCVLLEMEVVNDGGRWWGVVDEVVVVVEVRTWYIPCLHSRPPCCHPFRIICLYIQVNSLGKATKGPLRYFQGPMSLV